MSNVEIRRDGKNITPLQQKILDLMENGSLTFSAQEIATQIGITPNHLYKEVHVLRSKGFRIETQWGRRMVRRRTRR